MKHTQQNMVIALILTGLALYWYFNLREGWQSAPTQNLQRQRRMQYEFYNTCGGKRFETFYNNTETTREALRMCALKWCSTQYADNDLRPPLRACLDSCAYEFPSFESAPRPCSARTFSVNGRTVDRATAEDKQYCEEANSQGRCTRRTLEGGKTLCVWNSTPYWSNWQKCKKEGKKWAPNPQNIGPLATSTPFGHAGNIASYNTKRRKRHTELQDIRTGIGNPTQP